MQDTIKREKALRQKGEHFFFRDLEDPKQSPLKSYWLLKASALIGGVVAFSVIFILSYFVILCDKWVIKGWGR